MKLSCIMCVLFIFALVLNPHVYLCVKLTSNRLKQTFYQIKSNTVKNVNLTPTLNFSDEEYFMNETEEKPTIMVNRDKTVHYVIPRIVSFLQKSEKTGVDQSVVKDVKGKSEFSKVFEKNKGNELELSKLDKNLTYKSASKDPRGVFSSNKIYHHSLEDYATPILKAYNYNPLFEKIHSRTVETPNYVKRLIKNNPVEKPDIPKSFLPVQKVKELSPAGKADFLLRSIYKDKEYIKILDKGYESPRMRHSITGAKPTPVLRASQVDFLWSHQAGEKDKNLWGNVEYNRYSNDITNKISSVTAKFSIDDLGAKRVDAPPNSGLQITSEVPSFNVIH